ncbi:MAG: ABC transporter permease [Planctomycetes bacterium]|nr:ABC transporter permease [Planctomycetota bacterium]
MMERRVRQLLAVPELGIAFALLFFSALFWLINPALLTTGSLGAMLRALAFVGIIAVGQTMLMIAGELDLSVGSVAGLCAVLASWLTKEKGWAVPPAVAAGLLAGGAVGLANGLLAVRARIPAFIVTLGMLYIARGLNYLLCAGYPIYPLPAALAGMGKASPLGLSWAFFAFLGIAALGQLALARTVYGRAIYATGGNCEVARLAGIRTGAVKIGCYVLTGALAALSGMLLMAQLNVGQPEIGAGWELEVIAGVVIGGVSLFGGVGTIAGTVLGLLLMQVVRSGLALSSANTHWQTVAVGAIMIAAVGLDLWRRRAKR